MVRRSAAATLAPFGVPESAFEELNTERLQRTVSENEANRVRSATTQDFYVYPRSAGLYKVNSTKEGETDDMYQVNLHSKPACSCSDFLYRCSSIGIACKHIWRVRFLIKLGCLPSADESPYVWLINELYKDREWLQSIERDTVAEETSLTELEEELTNMNRIEIDYKYALNRRAQIMLRQSTPTALDI